MARHLDGETGGSRGRTRGRLGLRFWRDLRLRFWRDLRLRFWRDLRLRSRLSGLQRSRRGRVARRCRCRRRRPWCRRATPAEQPQRGRWRRRWCRIVGCVSETRRHDRRNDNDADDDQDPRPTRPRASPSRSRSGRGSGRMRVVVALGGRRLGVVDAGARNTNGLANSTVTDGHLCPSRSKRGRQPRFADVDRHTGRDLDALEEAEAPHARQVTRSFGAPGHPQSAETAGHRPQLRPRSVRAQSSRATTLQRPRGRPAGLDVRAPPSVSRQAAARRGDGRRARTGRRSRPRRSR